MTKPTKRAGNSKRSASPRPFTVDHFRRYAALMRLDSGENWDVEDFQLMVLEDVFAGAPEVWVVVPEGNGKTTLMGGFALYHADYTPQASVLMAAASRDQCGLLLGQAAGFVYRTPELQKRFRVFEGYRRITALRTQGRIQVFAADDRTGDGVIPTLGLVDELHRHPDMRLYRTWRGKLDKRDGQLVAISTAGLPESEFENTRARAKAEGDVTVTGQHVRAEAADMVLHDWAVRPDQDFDDLEVVKAANPFSGVTVEKLRKRKASPAMTAGHWARFVCNVPFVIDGAWLPPDAWEACRDDGCEIPDGSPVTLGVDIGRKHDHTAVVALWNRPDGRTVVKCRVFVPPTDGSSLSLEEVENHIRALAHDFQVQGVVYDPWSFERSAQMLSDEGLLMVEHPMSPERMHRSSALLYEAVMEKKLAHDGDPVLAAHVAAGASKDTERGWRLAKNPKAKRPIDALMALCVGYSVASQHTGGGGFEW